MSAIIHPDAPADQISAPAPFRAARRVRSLSDRSIAWLFVTPTIALLLAINIFPLIWMIRLSFTSLNLSTIECAVDLATAVIAASPGPANDGARGH
jgi:multiple sugar transport system permease protein